MRRRNHSVTVRMDDEEYKTYEEKQEASGQSKQDYAVNALTTAVLLSGEEVRELQELNRLLADANRQLRGISANVNQMAKYTNQVGTLCQNHELGRMADSVLEARKECEDLWQSIRRLLSRQKVMEA